VRARVGIDGDTVRALFTFRVHVLRSYSRRVIRPVFHELTRLGSATLLAQGSPNLLVRHPMLLDEQARRQLRELVERYDVLRPVIDFRDRLQRIWDETSASHGRALGQLRELSAQAEGSRIVALREFARSLSTYAPAESFAYDQRRVRLSH
jgi:hypothetical protein